MSKKDYELLAKTFTIVRRQLTTREELSVLAELIAHTADALAANNRNFKKQLWIKACLT